MERVATVPAMGARMRVNDRLVSALRRAAWAWSICAPARSTAACAASCWATAWSTSAWALSARARSPRRAGQGERGEGEVGAALRAGGAGDPEVGAGLRHLREVGGGVDLREQVALAHHAVEVHGDAQHAAAHLGAHLHLQHGLHASRGADGLVEVAAHPRPRSTAAPRASRRAGPRVHAAAEGDRAEGDEDPPGANGSGAASPRAARRRRGAARRGGRARRSSRRGDRGGGRRGAEMPRMRGALGHRRRAPPGGGRAGRGRSAGEGRSPWPKGSARSATRARP